MTIRKMFREEFFWFLDGIILTADIANTRIHALFYVGGKWRYVPSLSVKNPTLWSFMNSLQQSGNLDDPLVDELYMQQKF